MKLGTEDDVGFSTLGRGKVSGGGGFCLCRDVCDEMLFERLPLDGDFRSCLLEVEGLTIGFRPFISPTDNDPL
jgi:hypothetical protein